MCSKKKNVRDKGRGTADLQWQDPRTSFWGREVYTETCKMSWRRIEDTALENTPDK